MVETSKALGRSRRSFELLANAMPQVVWTAQEHEALVYCNTTFLELSGRSREQVLGGSWLMRR